ncbi:MAG: site-specific integrase [Candidatus Omnitrophota bacterium]
MLSRRKAIEKYEQYLEQINQSKAYLNYIKVLFKYLNKNKLTLFELTEEQLLVFLSRYSINSKNLFLKAIKSYCNYFNIKTQLTKIKSIRPDVKIKDYPSESEIKAISYNLKPKEKLILDFLTETMLRKAELLHLKQSDFNFEKRTCKVKGKGRKERIVCFSPSVANEVKRLFAQEPERTNAFNYSVGKLRGLCKRITEKLQTKVTPHSCRHIGAINLYHKGLDLITISRLLGHSNISTTQIYLNETSEKVIEHYNAVMMKV